MEALKTLTALLTHSENNYQVFDLGRRICPIEARDFENIEQGKQAYPFPSQRKAHLAVVYWNQDQQPWIWFLKFELDERGLIKPADTSNFIKYVLEAMGSRLSKEMDEETEQKLANNPYTFKPSEDKMAMLHSLIRGQLNLPASAYYEHAQHYFSGGIGWNNWQSVGLQGITDICARLANENNGTLMRKAVSQLPNEPLYALLGALEHVGLPEKLAVRLAELATDIIEQKDSDIFLLAAYMRALAGAEKAVAQPVLKQILNSPSLSHQEMLIAIAGRCWHLLADQSSAQLFLLRLAQTNNQALFNQVFADLVMLPELRLVLLPLLHTSPSPELAQALLQLQTTAKSGVQ